ncbi:hypothetical protein LTR28_012401, partial [Elasticomyces elasticus]
PLQSFLPPPPPTPSHTGPTRLIAPASTILFVPNSHTATTPHSPYPASNLPSPTHWTAYPRPSSILLLSQPPDQSCAVLGDILATRLRHRGVRAVVVDGRVRDLKSLAGLQDGGFGVWTRGTSVVGAGAEAKAWAVDVGVKVGKVGVEPGDIVFADAEERGVVVIPKDRLEEVVEMLPRLKEADEKCLEDVRSGIDVAEAFARHRG